MTEPETMTTTAGMSLHDRRLADFLENMAEPTALRWARERGCFWSMPTQRATATTFSQLTAMAASQSPAELTHAKSQSC
jgi:hypothetical protein